MLLFKFKETLFHVDVASIVYRFVQIIKFAKQTTLQFLATFLKCRWASDFFAFLYIFVFPFSGFLSNHLYGKHFLCWQIIQPLITNWKKEKQNHIKDKRNIIISIIVLYFFHFFLFRAFFSNQTKNQKLFLKAYCRKMLLVYTLFPVSDSTPSWYFKPFLKISKWTNNKQ